MNFSPGPWEVIILTLAAVAGFAFAVVRKCSPKAQVSTIMPRVTASLLAVVAGIFVLGLTMALFVIPHFSHGQGFKVEQPAGQAVPTTSHPVNLRTTLPPTAAELSPYPGNQGEWAEIGTKQFTANIYPSLTNCLSPLARHVRDLLSAKMSDGPSVSAGKKPELSELSDATAANSDSQDAGEQEDNATAVPTLTLHVAGHLLSDKDRSIVLQRFQMLLQKEFSEDAIRIAPTESVPSNTAEQEPGDNTVVLTLHIEEQNKSPAGWDDSVLQRSGQLRCDILSPFGTSFTTLGFIEKPWIDHFDAFVSQYPDQHFVVGYSGEFTSSESEARRQAMLNAKRRFRLVLPNGHVLHPDMAQVVDRFAQKLSRPYGDVWREAVLMNVSHPRMQSKIAAVRNQLQQTQTRHRSVLASLALLFGITVLVSVILNFLTQGYYRQRLLIAGVLVTAGLLVAMIFAVRSDLAIVPLQEAASATEFIP